MSPVPKRTGIMRKSVSVVSAKVWFPEILEAIMPR